jgi:hypothetical protein
MKIGAGIRRSLGGEYTHTGELFQKPAFSFLK